MVSSHISRTVTPCPATTGSTQETIGTHHIRTYKGARTPESNSRPEADDVFTRRQTTSAWTREIVGMA
eukprot:3333228-Lingulodinium_polyedra.AAC.1